MADLFDELQSDIFDSIEKHPESVGKQVGDVMKRSVVNTIRRGPTDYIGTSGLGPGQVLLNEGKKAVFEKMGMNPLVSTSLADATEPQNAALAAVGSEGLIKGPDKLITSFLRRIGGKTSGDIKSYRELSRLENPGFAMSKMKAKPQFLSREIAPKATELASSRVRSMEPEALREIGVTPESTQIAQNVKQKFGLNEFPTKAKADEFFEQVIDSAPPDSKIIPSNLIQAIDDLESFI